MTMTDTTPTTDHEHILEPTSRRCIHCGATTEYIEDATTPPTPKPMGSRRSWVILAAIAAATTLTIVGATNWEHQREQQQQDQQVDHLVEQLCTQTPDC
jgi:hypothetical protein